MCVPALMMVKHNLQMNGNHLVQFKTPLELIDNESGGVPCFLNKFLMFRIYRLAKLPSAFLYYKFSYAQ